MKKTVSLLLSVVMLLSALMVNTTVYAAGWAASTKNIELGVTYTDSVSVTDYKDSLYYYDSFKFTIPCEGTISFILNRKTEIIL